MPLPLSAATEIALYITGSYGHRLNDIQIEIYSGAKKIRTISTQEVVTRISLDDGGYAVKVWAYAHVTSTIHLLVDKVPQFIPVCLSLSLLGTLITGEPVPQQFETFHGKIVTAKNRVASEISKYFVRITGLYCEYNRATHVSKEGTFVFPDLRPGLYGLYVVGPEGIAQSEVISVSRDKPRNYVSINIK